MIIALLYYFFLFYFYSFYLPIFLFSVLEICRGNFGPTSWYIVAEVHCFFKKLGKWQRSSSSPFLKKHWTYLFFGGYKSGGRPSITPTNLLLDNKNMMHIKHAFVFICNDIFEHVESVSIVVSCHESSFFKINK